MTENRYPPDHHNSSRLIVERPKNPRALYDPRAPELFMRSDKKPRRRSNVDKTAMYVGIDPAEQPVMDVDKRKVSRIGLEATTRQKVFMRAICELSTSDKGPSFREVQERMGLKSVRAVQKVVISLKRKGLVYAETDRITGIRLTDRGLLVLRVFLKTAEAFAIDVDAFPA